MIPIPVYPFAIPWLQPFSNYAPLIWLCGVSCLWLTRYTHQLARRWGVRYYWVSAFVRPLGVLLIIFGWMALFAIEEGVIVPGNPNEWGETLGLQGGRPSVVFWLNLLWMMGALLSMGLGLWAIAVLGLRRSFFYRRLDDPLVTRGPYSIVRHPQFLSAIGVTFFTVMVYVSSYRLARGGGPWVPFWDRSGVGFANWVLFTVTLWILAVLEDRELAAHFGVEYEEYTRCVPRLFPN